MTPNKYTYAWAVVAGAIVTIETIALLDRPEATLTHHLKTLAKTRPRRLLLLTAVLWTIPHLDLHNLKGGDTQ